VKKLKEPQVFYSPYYDYLNEHFSKTIAAIEFWTELKTTAQYIFHRCLRLDLRYVLTNVTVDLLYVMDGNSTILICTRVLSTITS
jgi:hypothetical protein